MGEDAEHPRDLEAVCWKRFEESTRRFSLCGYLGCPSKAGNDHEQIVLHPIRAEGVLR